MTGLGNNPFSKLDKNKDIDAIADVLAKSQADRAGQLPDNITQAAKDAGAEARTSDAKTIETRNSIYNKHFTKAIGDTPVSSNSRQEFEKIADQEWHTPPTG